MLSYAKWIVSAIALSSPLKIGGYHFLPLYEPVVVSLNTQSPAYSAFAEIAAQTDSQSSQLLPGRFLAASEAVQESVDPQPLYLEEEPFYRKELATRLHQAKETLAA